MYKQNWYFGILILFFTTAGNAQLQIGQWQVHAAYNRASMVCEAGDLVYCASENGIFSYNINEGYIETNTKATSLTDVNISAIKYNTTQAALFVGYQSGNIDILYENETTTISDIKRAQLFGPKGINDFCNWNDFVFVATDFGIVKLNLIKNEVSETYFIGDNASMIKVFEIEVFDNYIYAATEKGLYRCATNAPNPIDYSYWELLGQTKILGISVSNLASNGTVLYLSTSINSVFSDAIYSFNNNTFTEIIGGIDQLQDINIHNDKIWVAEKNAIREFSLTGTERNKIDLFDTQTAAPKQLAIGQNSLWIADISKGLVNINETYQTSSYKPEGPSNVQAFRVNNSGSSFWVAGGGVAATWNNMWLTGQYAMYQNNEWKTSYHWGFKDFMQVVQHPQNESLLFAASWGDGLFVIENGKITTQFDQSNSSLQNIGSTDGYVRIGGFDFDTQGNLWVANSEVPNLLSVYTSDGEWTGIDCSKMFGTMPVASKILVSSANQVWVTLPKSNRIFIYDFNGTPKDITDDQSMTLAVVDNEGVLISDLINDFAQDSQGNVWLATGAGTPYYSGFSNIFDDEYKQAISAYLDSQEDDQLVHSLLKSENVTCIEIDGGDRKWLGTENSGVFCISESSKQELYHFTAENSPLLSNSILDLAINKATGELMFVTENGLCSFMAEATEPSDFYSDVYVYPNPIRPNYTGNIVIKGLVANTNVKITDIAGNLVYETKSIGGQAIWDGVDLFGNDLKSGVYLVFMNNETGSFSHSTKFLVVR